MAYDLFFANSVSSPTTAPSYLQGAVLRQGELGENPGAQLPGFCGSSISSGFTAHRWSDLRKQLNPLVFINPSLCCYRMQSLPPIMAWCWVPLLSLTLCTLSCLSWIVVQLLYFFLWNPASCYLLISEHQEIQSKISTHLSERWMAPEVKLMNYQEGKNSI